MKKIAILTFLSTLFLFATQNNIPFFKEKEPNNTFKEAMQYIIPMPDIKREIDASLNEKDNKDIFLIYLTRPSKIKLIYSSNVNFKPGIVFFNEFKQYMGLKTYASSKIGEFYSKYIEMLLLKPGFYFIEVKNLFRVHGKYKYKIKFTPIDAKDYPFKVEKKPKININNLTQEKLREIFYKNIIKKFKNIIKYNNFRE